MGFMGYGRGGKSLQNENADNAQKAIALARSGITHLQEGDLRQAEYDLYKAVLLSPEHAGIHAYFALALHRQGRLEDANKEMQAAISIAPQDETVLKVAGMLAETPAPAAVAKTSATVQVEESPAVLIAASAASATQRTAAIAKLEAEIATNPNDSRLHRDLSILYLKAGRVSEAKEHTRLADSLRKRVIPSMA